MPIQAITMTTQDHHGSCLDGDKCVWDGSRASATAWETRCCAAICYLSAGPTFAGAISVSDEISTSVATCKFLRQFFLSSTQIERFFDCCPVFDPERTRISLLSV